MNYQSIYNSLISKRQNKSFAGYGEKHHIIPKSLGGSNDKSNIVKLTAREHFIAHWLLKKIHNNEQMIFAFFAMTKMGNKHQKRYNSKSFQYARKSMAEHLSKTRTGEMHPMFGLKGKDNPNYGSKRNKETRAKLSCSAKNRTSKSGRSRKVLRVETNTMYESLGDAKKENKGNVSYSARTGGTANGYHFNYIDSNGERIIPECKLKGYPSGKETHNSISVINLTSNELFNTVKKAGESIGVTGSAISWCIKNKKPCKGFYFEKV